jgi:hypothetical protein
MQNISTQAYGLSYFEEDSQDQQARGGGLGQRKTSL